MTEATVTKNRKIQKAPKLFSDELIDQLLAQLQSKGCGVDSRRIGFGRAIEEATGERMLAAELSHQSESEVDQGVAGNHRNGNGKEAIGRSNCWEIMANDPDALAP
jgi:hypothetical protein